MMRATIDTNVLFEGLSRRGPCGEVVESWVSRRFVPCVSTALALAYESVLQRKSGGQRVETVLMALQALLARCEWVPVPFSWRPSSPDPGDDLVVDCVVCSRSSLVTRNLRDFSEPSRSLGFPLLSPEEFLDRLKKEEADEPSDPSSS